MENLIVIVACIIIALSELLASFDFRHSLILFLHLHSSGSTQHTYTVRLSNGSVVLLGNPNIDMSDLSTEIGPPLAQ